MRIGVCGLGLRIAHVLGFFMEQVADARVVAYCDSSPLGADYLRERGIALGKVYATVEQMLADEPLDLLMIGSPNHLHLEHIMLGLAAGVRIFVEKPVVISEQEVFALLDLLEKHGPDQVLIGLVLRYSPLYRALVNTVRRDLLGPLSSVEAAEHISPDHGGFFMRDWRRYEHYSGGYLLEKCCHDLDIYSSIIDSTPLRVASFGGRHTFVPANEARESLEVYHSKKAGWDSQPSVFRGDADIVDNQVVIVEYASGTHFSFHLNQHVPRPFRRFCLVGLHGTAEGDFERNYLHVHDAATSERMVDWAGVEGPGHYGAEPLMVADIVAHLRDGRPLPVSAVDALRTTLLALKIDEARRLGAVLDLTATWQRFEARTHRRSLLAASNAA